MYVSPKLLQVFVCSFVCDAAQLYCMYALYNYRPPEAALIYSQYADPIPLNVIYFGDFDKRQSCFKCIEPFCFSLVY